MNEYKGDNTFEQGDELLIVDQCNMTNTEVASEYSAIASEAEPGASTSGASDSDSQ